MSYELAEAGFEDLKEIYNQYSPDQDFDTANADAEEMSAAMTKEMVKSIFDIELDEDADVDTPEKLQAYIAEKMAERVAERERQAQESKAHRAKKPKSAQQLKADAKRAAQDEKRKQEEIMHPFIKETVPVGLLFYIQALLLSRFLRGDLDGYPVFIWK